METSLQARGRNKAIFLYGIKYGDILWKIGDGSRFSGIGLGQQQD
jgi:hypothetical protein